MTCPNCNGSNVQTTKMAIAGGTSTGTGVGLGLSGGGGIGAGIGRTRNESVLVKDLKKEPEPPYLNWACCVTFFALGIWGYSSIHPLFGCLLLLGGIQYLFKAITGSSKSREIQQEWTEQTERGWVCHQCGHRWVPRS